MSPPARAGGIFLRFTLPLLKYIIFVKGKNKNKKNHFYPCQIISFFYICIIKRRHYERHYRHYCIEYRY